MKQTGSRSQPAAGGADRAGFTLMEVALAVAVVTIGVLSLFALISAGLKESAKGVADTQAALFADSVFNGLGATSQSAAEAGVVGTEVKWCRFWADFRSGATNISIAAASTWASPLTPIYGDDQLRTVKFVNLPMRSKGAAVKGIVNQAMRYRIAVSSQHPIVLTSTDNNRIQVKLWVWDGEFGGTNDPLPFYSEFDNPGDL